MSVKLRFPCADARRASPLVPAEGLLKLPAAADPPEAWDPIWRALGRPDDPKGYGVDAFKVVAGLAGKLTAATREGSFGGTGTPAQGGYEYAVQANTNKDHPDYAKYWAGDKEVVRRVNEGWKQMPKGK